MNTQAPTDRRTRSWLDDLTIELRLRKVRGEAIGDAVTSVESHLAESGESATEAFGTPREYAESLEFTPDQYTQSSARSWASALAPVVTGLLGMTLAVEAAPALRDGHDVEVTWGRLGALAALALVVFAVVRLLGPILRQPITSSIAFGALVVAIGMMPVLFDATAFTMPVLVAAVLAAGLLAASVVTAYRLRRVPADPVTDPVTGGDRHRATGLAGLTRALTPWVFVLAAVAFGALGWFSGS